MKDHSRFTTGVSDRFLKSIHGKLRIDPVAVNTCYYTTVIKVDDRTVLPPFVLAERQISEVHTPLGIASVSTKVLIQEIFEKPIRFRAVAMSAFRLASDRLQAKFFVHVFMNCGQT